MSESLSKQLEVLKEELKQSWADFAPTEDEQILALLLTVNSLSADMLMSQNVAREDVLPMVASMHLLLDLIDRQRQ